MFIPGNGCGISSPLMWVSWKEVKKSLIAGGQLAGCMTVTVGEKGGWCVCVCDVMYWHIYLIYSSNVIL